MIYRIGGVRLLSLDYDPVYGDTRTIRSTFTSDRSVFDFDVVIWDPRGSFQTYHSYSYFQGLPSLSDHESVRIKADLMRRLREFIEFVDSGRILVVIIRPPQKCYIDTGRRTYSGTGRNQKETIQVGEFDLLKAIPIKDLEFIPARGDRISIVGDGPLSAFLRKYKNYLTYEAVMKESFGTVLAQVAGTDRGISSILQRKNGGYIILLPAAQLRAAEDTEDQGETDGDADEAASETTSEWSDIAPEFQWDLMEAIEALSGVRSASRPAWAQYFLTKEQKRLRVEVAKQQDRVEQARGKLSALQQQEEAEESRDQLFLGSGRALELEVRVVLELLGGTVTEPSPGRDDWKVSFPEGDAVVEVKGVTKSAAEKHAAQLEKWVAGTYEESGKIPKGILVVNTWREVPLDERNAVSFPNQMLTYSVGRNHCLVTGLQLFFIRADVEKRPSRAKHWRKALMGTAGTISGCDDWRAVIEKIEAEEEIEPQEVDVSASIPSGLA